MAVERYLDAVGWQIAEDTTIAYLNDLRSTHAVSTYLKHFFQIRKFCRFMGADFVDGLDVPQSPDYNNINIYRAEDIRAAYDVLSRLYTRRYSAALLIGATSGLRAHELYNLDYGDIDVERRTIKVRKSKTGRKRIAFFNHEAQREYVAFLEEDRGCCKEFDKPFHINATRKHFRRTNIMPKHLRKFFSQEWDRQGGNTNIKKLLMGHSTRNSVDLNHYAAHSEEDLKSAYDNLNLNIFS